MIKKISAGDQPTPEGEGGEMSFLDHLEEPPSQPHSPSPCSTGANTAALTPTK